MTFSFRRLIAYLSGYVGLMADIEVRKWHQASWGQIKP